LNSTTAFKVHTHTEIENLTSLVLLHPFQCTVQVKKWQGFFRELINAVA